MSTINDVARAAKVAKSTVSNVLNNTKNVSPSVRARVLTACKDLNYIPNFTASSLVTKKTKIIGLYLGTEKQYQDFYSVLIKAVMIAAGTENYKILLYYFVDSQEMSSALGFDKGLLDGAIFLTPLVHDFRIEHMTVNEIPFVLIGRSEELTNAYSVDVDNVNLTYEIAQRLIQLGHQNILFFNGNPDYTISIDRLIGFNKALQQYKIDSKNCSVVNTDNSGTQALNYLRETISGFKYTAIIVPSDIIGAILYPILQANRYTVGEDIAVASLGGTSVAFDLVPKLTTTKQNYNEIGTKAFELLHALMNGKTPEEEQVVIESDIIFTNSCSPVKQ